MLVHLHLADAFVQRDLQMRHSHGSVTAGTPLVYITSTCFRPFVSHTDENTPKVSRFTKGSLDCTIAAVCTYSLCIFGIWGKTTTKNKTKKQQGYYV